jgi:hypothetical protein
VILDVPAAIPVTTPAAVTDAFVRSLLLHDNKPVVALAKEVVLPAQTACAPVIADGLALTVMITDFEHEFGNV